jgi:hypothetical protein
MLRQHLRQLSLAHLAAALCATRSHSRRRLSVE